MNSNSTTAKRKTPSYVAASTSSGCWPKASEAEAVAKATGYTRPWIRKLVRRYNAQGHAGLEDRRHHNPGQRLGLSPEQVQALEVALEQPPDDGGLWTGPKVAAWIAQVLGRPVKRHLGWRWLRRLGYTLHVPRPSHVQADPTVRALFKNAWLGPSRRATSRVSARPHRTLGDG
jgi:transposase